MFGRMKGGLAALWPRHCAVCSCWLPGPSFWMVACAVCTLEWPELMGEFGSILMKERCRMAYAGVGFRLSGNGTLKAQLTDMKYGGNRRLAHRWGHWLGCQLRPPAVDAASLVLAPVPLHWRKRWQRGYNQAEWIARGLGKAWGIPVDPFALRRLEHQSSLTSHSRAARAAMTRDLYAARGSATDFVGKSVVVVDDVLTTGATLAACGAALKSRGIDWKGGVVLALA